MTKETLIIDSTIKIPSTSTLEYIDEKYFVADFRSQEIGENRLPLFSAGITNKDETIAQNDLLLTIKSIRNYDEETRQIIWQ